ncbi:response regulator transcription factor [Vagococcus intermedius]|uniref:Response regulator n=1 Tax=Vagococcus intermedius TaxID=2991418 RepID=A0AAF0CVE6_9ENTE|nr:response regulator [Vagococcus intermedius]WEG73674.1 response regulator [Vagococcus intermedius]WEG75758.1 response regulator [Vagococcus intermedius]
MTFTLLIIDDEPIIRRGLANSVKKNTTIFTTILQAESANEALAYAKTLPKPDVIFADINLPDMNGLDLIKQLKYLIPNTLVVVISGYDDFSYARQAIHLQVFDYLLKPIPPSDMKQLLLKVEEQLQLLPKKITPPKARNLSQAAANYLQEHYAKKDLTLAMVAADLFVDTSYLSKQMKQEFGKSFNDFLTELRIRKACELLMLEPIAYPIHEIGEKVGYPNQHYFSRIFKQRTGFTPSYYRKYHDSLIKKEP